MECLVKVPVPVTEPPTGSGLEKPLTLISFHPPALGSRDTFPQTRLLRASSNPAWNTSRARAGRPAVPLQGGAPGAASRPGLTPRLWAPPPQGRVPEPRAGRGPHQGLLGGGSSTAGRGQGQRGGAAHGACAEGQGRGGGRPPAPLPPLPVPAPSPMAALGASARLAAAAAL